VLSPGQALRWLLLAVRLGRSRRLDRAFDELALAVMQGPEPVAGIPGISAWGGVTGPCCAVAGGRCGLTGLRRSAIGDPAPRLGGLESAGRAGDRAQAAAVPV